MSFKIVATLTILLIALVSGLVLSVAIWALPIFFAPIGGMAMVVVIREGFSLIKEVWSMR